MHQEFAHLPLASIQKGQYQPRQHFDAQSLQELADSIQSQGLIEPLVVRELAKNQYELIAGERRLRAAFLAGLQTVPCLIGQYSDQQACALALIENIQRENLNLIEEANAYRRLSQEFNYHQEEIATLVGKSRSHVANILRLLSLCAEVRERLIKKEISLGHARMLVGLEPFLQENIAQQIVEQQWSVRQVEQALKKEKSSALQNPKKDKDVERLQRILSEQVGAPVQIESEKDEGGWLKLKFFNNDTLAGLLERLGLRYDGN